jgi:hypothetical protein
MLSLSVLLNVILKIGLSDARCSQAGWCFFLGLWAAKNATRFSREGADCFFDFGAHRLCLVTLLLAAQSDLFLLMLHALLSRVVTPGKSIFLDASVGKSSFTFLYGFAHPWQLLVLQVLDSSESGVAMSEMTTADDEAPASSSAILSPSNQH